MRRFWRWFLAFWRVSGAAVCEMSAGRGLVDFHDYPDAGPGSPAHAAVPRCKRCGKVFQV